MRIKECSVIFFKEILIPLIAIARMFEGGRSVLYSSRVC